MTPASPASTAPAEHYDRTFFEDQRGGSRRSASIILPPVLELLKPKRIVDVGCGLGPWIAEARDAGAEEILGIDGDYIDREQLDIPVSAFHPHDLATPLELKGERFDLAMSLEVAEHLPVDRGEPFIAELCALADVVLFSAAIPEQGGEQHLNERWQSYWASVFASHGYVPLDIVRPRVWDDDRVEWWYRQNTLLYVAESALSDRPELADLVTPEPGRPLDLVHPGRYRWLLRQVERENAQVREQIEQANAKATRARDERAAISAERDQAVARALRAERTASDIAARSETDRDQIRGLLETCDQWMASEHRQRDQIDRLQATVSDLEASLRQAREQVNSTTAERDAAAEDAANAREQIAALTQELEQARTTLNESNRACDDLLASEHRAREEAASARAQINELLATCDAYVTRESDIRSDAQRARSEADDARTEAEGLRAELTRAEQRIVSLSDDADQLRSQINELLFACDLYLQQVNDPAHCAQVVREGIFRSALWRARSVARKTPVVRTVLRPVYRGLKRVVKQNA